MTPIGRLICMSILIALLLIAGCCEKPYDVLLSFTIMYGGDDVGALVIDTGTAITKSGFAGENVPKSVLNTAVGKFINESNAGEDVQMKDVGNADAETKEKRDDDDGKPEASPTSQTGYVLADKLHRRQDNLELISPVQDGLVNDWDAIEALWNYALSSQLQIQSQEHPMLLVESTFNTPERREKMVELVFEKFETPAVFLAKDSVLSAFAVGRSTALVVNCGAGVTSTVAVHEGFALKTGATRTKVAGNELDRILETMLEPQQHPIRPRYEFNRTIAAEGRLKIEKLDFPHTTASYAAYMKQEILRDIKHSVVRASDAPFDAESNVTIPTMPYELPDGHLLEIGTDRFTLSEQLFRPTLLQITTDFDGYQFAGLPNMVRETIEKTDVDLRRDLYGSIVVTGGTSAIRGMSERLYKELVNTAAPAYKVKTLSVSSHTERLFGPWIGGSILGSLGSFHQMWFSKAEYDEHGAKLIAKKCP